MNPKTNFFNVKQKVVFTLDLIIKFRLILYCICSIKIALDNRKAEKNAHAFIPINRQ